MIYHLGIIDIYFSKVKLHFYVFFPQLSNLYNNLVILLHFPLGYLQMDSRQIEVWFNNDDNSFVDVISIS